MKGLIILVYLLALCIAESTSAKTYDINDYGAEADGKTLNTIAIQKAVYACTSGDTVLIPAAQYLTGTIHLKSNITLYLEKESMLIGSTHLTDYESYTLSNGSTGYYGILYTTGAENVAIVGLGVIQGGKQAFPEPTSTTLYADTALLKYTRQQGNYRNGFKSIAAIAPGNPQSAVLFTGCKGILVNNISLLNTTGITLSFVACERVSVADVIIETPLQALGVSGVAIEGCRQVILKGCEIRSGGDAIVICGHLEHSNQSSTIPSQNISIANCSLQSSSTAINITALNQASVTGVQVSQVNIIASGRGVGLLLRNAGSLENMSFSDMYIETKQGYGNGQVNGEPIHASAVAGKDSVNLGLINRIAFNNIFCVGENQILLYGSAQSLIQNVQFNDVLFHIKNSAYNNTIGGNIVLWGNADQKSRLFASNIPAVMASYVTGLSFNNIKVSWVDNAMPAYFTAGIQINNFKDIRLTRCYVKAAPLSHNTHDVELTDGSLAAVDAGDVSRIRVQENKPIKSSSRLVNQHPRYK